MVERAHPSRHLSLVKDAIDVVLRPLSTIPLSAETERLLGKIDAYMREVEAWQVSPPQAAERDKFMKQVLKLHMELAKLERGIVGT